MLQSSQRTRRFFILVFKYLRNYSVVVSTVNSHHFFEKVNANHAAVTDETHDRKNKCQDVNGVNELAGQSDMSLQKAEKLARDRGETEIYWYFCFEVKKKERKKKSHRNFHFCILGTQLLEHTSRLLLPLVQRGM